MKPTEPPPPSNLEAEMAVLGAVISDATGAAWRRVASTLRPDHFSEPIHARIFNTASTLFSNGVAVSPMVLKSHFETDSTLKELGGLAYFASLISVASIPISLPTHAGIVRDMASRREAIRAARDLSEAAAIVDANTPFSTALADHAGTIQRLFDDGQERRTSYTIDQACVSMVDRVACIRTGAPDPNAIKTGIEAFDKYTGGLHRAEYVILGARPSMGKTGLAVQIASNVSESGGGVAYFSLEMPVGLLTPRFASSKLWTPGATHNVAYQSILRGELSDRELEWTVSAAKEMQAWPLIIDDAPGLTPAELEARTQVMKAKFERQGKRLDLIICDHIHKMRQPGATSKVAEYTEISARLAEMAKRLDCPVLALAQLNRAVESRDNKRPQLSDLRESGSIEQDADTVLFCYRPAYYLERRRCADPSDEADRIADLDAVKNKLELLIEKQRSGPIGTLDLWCDMAANVVRDPVANDYSERYAA